MTERQYQSLFALNVSKLISYAYEIGYEITLGEVLRPTAMQLLYYNGYDVVQNNNKLELVVTFPKSKTMNSYHLRKLAIDINVFINGEYRSDKEAHKPLAEYWKKLHPKNISGYDWNFDWNHYQMTI